jgi:hypothetical protein
MAMAAVAATVPTVLSALRFSIPLSFLGPADEVIE